MAQQGSDAGNAQLTKIVILGSIALVGVGIAYFGIVRPIFCKIGLVKCKSGEENAQIILQNFDNKGWDPEYWRNHAPSLSWDRAKKLAENVYGAGGIFNDNEDVFYAALQEAKTYANLSLISYVFKNKYNKSLAEYYAYYLSDTQEQEKIKQILSEFK